VWVVVIEKPHKKTYTYSSIDTKVKERKQLPYYMSRCRLGGRIILPAKPTSTHSSWKTGRCRFGGRIIFPAKPTSTHSSWIQVDVGLAGELFFPPNLHLLTLLGK
jgi:hypothetical protein